MSDNPFDPKVTTAKERFLRNELAKQDRLIRNIKSAMGRDGPDTLASTLNTISELLRAHDQGD